MGVNMGFVLIAAALLTGLIQAIKQVPAIQSRLWLVPFVSLAFGVGLAIVAWASQAPGCEDLLTAVLSGVAAGLAAVGLYEAGKQAVQTK